MRASSSRFNESRKMLMFYTWKRNSVKLKAIREHDFVRIMRIDGKIHTPRDIQFFGNCRSSVYHFNLKLSSRDARIIFYS